RLAGLAAESRQGADAAVLEQLHDFVGAHLTAPHHLADDELAVFALPPAGGLAHGFAVERVDEARLLAVVVFVVALDARHDLAGERLRLPHELFTRQRAL